MNGLVLCTGANKTVGSLEFSKTRLQALVKSGKREQLLQELEREHSATGEEAIGADEGSITVSFCCSHGLQMAMQDHKILVLAERNAKPHDR